MPLYDNKRGLKTSLCIISDFPHFGPFQPVYGSCTLLSAKNNNNCLPLILIHQRQEKLEESCKSRLQGVARVLAAIWSKLLRTELYLRFIAESCSLTKLSVVSKTPKTEQAGTGMGGYRRNILLRAKVIVVTN